MHVVICRTAFCEELWVGNRVKSDSIELTLRRCYTGLFFKQLVSQICCDTRCMKNCPV